MKALWALLVVVGSWYLGCGLLLLIARIKYWIQGKPWPERVVTDYSCGTPPPPP